MGASSLSKRQIRGGKKELEEMGVAMHVMLPLSWAKWD
jgi:hypothetical protein